MGLMVSQRGQDRSGLKLRFYEKGTQSSSRDKFRELKSDEKYQISNYFIFTRNNTYHS